MTNAIIIVRSHMLDSHVIEARRALQAVSDYPVYLMVHDETGAMTAPDAAFLFSSRDVECLGISTFSSPRWAWYMGDCPLYVAFNRFPEADFVMMLEYDVRLNLDANILLSECAGVIDFFAFNAGFLDESWCWHAAASLWFSNPLGSFFPMVGVSRRLAAKAMNKRIAISKLWVEAGSLHADQASYMVHCEALVPSVCHEIGYTMADLKEIVPGWDSRFFTDVGIFPWESKDLSRIPAIHPAFPRAKIMEHYYKNMESAYVSLSAKIQMEQQMADLVAQGYFDNR